MKRSRQIEQCVERLCQKGCRSVREDIRRMEQGSVLPELEELDELARLTVLHELRAIMAVYGDSCPVVVAPENQKRGARRHGKEI